MSLKKTFSTEHWNTIPKKCKNCSKAIYTIEGKKFYYQCSLFGKFDKNCDKNLPQRLLLKPEQILKMENK